MADLPRPDPTPPDPPDAGGAESAAAQADRTERAFLDIVSRIGDDPGDATWPEAEEVRLPPHPPVVVVRPARSAHPSTDPDAPTETDLRPIDPAAGPVDDDGDEAASGDAHYVPPPLPRTPRMRPATRAALASVALGVAFLVAPALTGTEPSLAFETVAVMLVIGGVATLVARMREHPDPDDEPDDGAVV